MSDGATCCQRQVVSAAFLLFVSVLVACGQPDQPADSATVPDSPWPFGEPADASIAGSDEARARLADAPAKIIAAIARRDYAGLAEWVHPTAGLRLSPYAYVDLEHDVVLDPDTIRSAQKSGQSYLWGYADGTGDPIELPITDYFDRFVYAADFASAPQAGYDTTIGRGNSINNAREIYADAIIVEYHFSSIDKDMAGLDWKSLRLVFQHHAEKWYLCGIIRDVWTT